MESTNFKVHCIVHNDANGIDMHVLAAESRTAVPAAFVLHDDVVDEENEACAHRKLNLASRPAS